MSDLTRREAMQILGTIPLVAAGFSPQSVSRAAEAARSAVAAPGGYSPRFFTAHEFATVGILSDMVIPRDERSGGATDAGVAEFMDFILSEYPDSQTRIRGGLAWLDREANRRFGRRFAECPESGRRAILDDIAWPARARPEYSQGVAFFNRFRDLTASGFYSSKIGVEDLRYIGNQFVTEWTGCPPEALAKLGVRY